MNDAAALVNGTRILVIATACGPVLVHLTFWRHRQRHQSYPTRWQLARLFASLGWAVGMAMTLFNRDGWMWAGVAVFLTSGVWEQWMLTLERRTVRQTRAEL